MVSIQNNILKLSKEVADKIAAGEVVDRPVSIVKELMENAIDAGADSIIVEIKKGGRTYIRVTDNGCGIPSAEVELAFQRHATSKIRDAKDLNSIMTLGFRGEALASIVAVSRVEMITKIQEEKAGTRILIEGGQVAENTAAGCPEGTTIIISDLFYNTPARLKFMKPEGTESTLIIDLVSKMALAYPKIRIRLISNGSILFSTPGKGDALSNILTVYSKDLGRKLLPVSGQVLAEEGRIREGVTDDGRPWDIRLAGYISAVDETRSTRKGQIFFVNGRSIQSKVIERAVTAAYGDRLPERRFPVVFLFLTIAPEKVDVNIHPNKREVRFDDEKNVEAFIKAVVSRGLTVARSIPEIGSANVFKSEIPDRPVKQKSDAVEQVDIKKILSTKRAEEQKAAMKEAQGENPVEEQIEEFGNSLTGFKSDAAPRSEAIMEEPAPYGLSPAQEGTDAGITPSAPEFRPFDPEDIRITGSIFATYLTGVDDKYFYLIDQHAAHERVFYEALLDQYNNEEKIQQPILTPIIINVDHSMTGRANEWIPALEKMGYAIEEFGPKSYAVKSLPAFMSLTEGEGFVRDFIEGVSEEADVGNIKKLERIIMRSCKSAIKANDQLDLMEMKSLMADLAKTKNPFSCPHGRPTIVRVSQGQIERMFKRA